MFLSFFLVSFLQCAGPTKQVTPGNPLLELPSPDQDSIWAAPEAFLRFPTSQATINRVIAAVAGDNSALEEQLLPGDTSGVPVAPEDDEEDEDYEERLWQTKEREACKKFWGCTTQGKNSTEWGKVPFWSSVIKALEDMQKKASSLSPIEQAVSCLLRWMQGSTSGSYLPNSDFEGGLFFETLYPLEPTEPAGWVARTKNMLCWMSCSSQASPPLLFDAKTDAQEVIVQDLEVLKLLIRATWAKEQAEKPWLLEHYFSLIRDKLRAVPITATSTSIRAWYAENESDCFENAGFKGIEQYINNPGIGSLVRRIRNCIILTCCVGGAASYLMLKTQATSPRTVSVLPASALTSVLRPVCGSSASSRAFSSQSLGTQVGETVYFQASDNSAPASRGMHPADLQQDLVAGDFLRSAYGLVTAHQDCNFLTAVFEAIRHVVPAYSQVTVTFYNNGLGSVSIKTALATSSIPTGVSFRDSTATTPIAPNCIYVGGGELKSDDGSDYRMPSALPGQVVVVVIPNLALVSSSPAVDAPPKETTRAPTTSVAPPPPMSTSSAVATTTQRVTAPPTTPKPTTTMTSTSAMATSSSTQMVASSTTTTQLTTTTLVPLPSSTTTDTPTSTLFPTTTRVPSLLERLAPDLATCIAYLNPMVELDGFRGLEGLMDGGDCNATFVNASYYPAVLNRTFSEILNWTLSAGGAVDSNAVQWRIGNMSASSLMRFVNILTAADPAGLNANQSRAVATLLPIALQKCMQVEPAFFDPNATLNIRISDSNTSCLVFCYYPETCPSASCTWFSTGIGVLGTGIVAGGFGQDSFFRAFENIASLALGLRRFFNTTTTEFQRYQSNYDIATFDFQNRAMGGGYPDICSNWPFGIYKGQIVSPSKPFCAVPKKILKLPLPPVNI